MRAIWNKSTVVDAKKFFVRRHATTIEFLHPHVAMFASSSLFYCTDRQGFRAVRQSKQYRGRIVTRVQSNETETCLLFSRQAPPQFCVEASSVFSTSSVRSKNLRSKQSLSVTYITRLLFARCLETSLSVSPYRLHENGIVNHGR